MRFNGESLQGDWTGTRALHYGDGVFRTALVVNGTMVDRDLQLAKLEADAEALDLRFPDRAALETDIAAVLHAETSGVLRLILSRRDGGRGYAPSGVECDRMLQLRNLPDYPRACWERGITVGWSKVLLAVQPLLAGIKHLNRLEQVLASRRWPAEQHEVVMCDSEGRVTCGSRTNLFFVIDDILVTPDVSLAGVAGMMRDKLIRLARGCGIGCEVGLISPDEVRHASECFASNSLVGIWPIRQIGSLEFPAPGPRTQALMEHLQHPWSGR